MIHKTQQSKEQLQGTKAAREVSEAPNDSVRGSSRIACEPAFMTFA